MPKEMILKVSSPGFVFQKANVVIFRSHSPAGLEDFFEPSKLSILENAPEAKVIPLVNGATGAIRIAGPGKFTVSLHAVSFVRVRDGKEFHVNQYLAGELTVTESDLAVGEAQIDVNPEGVFKVLVLGKDGKPVPRKQVLFHDRRVVFEITTDENGESIFLGNPIDYHASLMPEGDDSVSLTILPV